MKMPKEVLQAAKGKVRATEDATVEIGKRLQKNADELRTTKTRTKRADGAMAGTVAGSLPERARTRVGSPPVTANMAKKGASDEQSKKKRKIDRHRARRHKKPPRKKRERLTEEELREIVRIAEEEFPFDTWTEIDLGNDSKP